MKNLIYMGWRFYFVTLSYLVSSNFVILSEKTPVEFSAGIFIMVLLITDVLWLKKSLPKNAK